MPTTAPLSAPSPPARKWRADVRADFPLYLAYLGLAVAGWRQWHASLEAPQQLAEQLP